MEAGRLSKVSPAHLRCFISRVFGGSPQVLGGLEARPPNFPGGAGTQQVNAPYPNPAGAACGRRVESAATLTNISIYFLCVNPNVQRFHGGRSLFWPRSACLEKGRASQAAQGLKRRRREALLLRLVAALVSWARLQPSWLPCSGGVQPANGATRASPRMLSPKQRCERQGQQPTTEVLLIASSTRTTREQINAWRAKKGQEAVGRDTTHRGEGKQRWGGAASSYKKTPRRTPPAVSSSF